MVIAPKRPHEEEVLAALYGLDVLDSAPDEQFDALVRVASMVCGTPIALLSLVDRDRQWFKANSGLQGMSEAPRDLAFCAYAVLQEGVMEIPNALLDPRFDDNPLVTGDTAVRFYAGAPIRMSDGAAVGTVCVIDQQPRTLTAQQRETLSLLATAAAHALEGRKAVRANLEELALRRAAESDLVHQRQRLTHILEGANAGSMEWNAATQELRFDARWAAITGYELDEVQRSGAISWSWRTHPEDMPRAVTNMRRHLKGQAPDYQCELRVRHKSGQWIWVLDRGKMFEGDWVMGTRTDISNQKQMEESLQRKNAELQVQHEHDVRTRQILDAIAEPILVKGEQSRIEWANRAFLEYYGTDLKTLRGLQGSGFEPPDLTLQYARDDLKVFTTGTVLEIPEELVRRHDGVLLTWHTVKSPMLDSKGKIVGTVGVSRDITAQKEGQAQIERMQNELRSNNQLLHTILENMPCGLSVFDAKNQLIAANTEFKVLFGYAASLLEDGPIPLRHLLQSNAAIGEYGDSDAEVAVTEGMARTAFTDNMQFERVRGNGKHLEVRLARLPGGGFISTHTDITA
ncbi:MAG: PAS domain S-box protein, partial [Ramlibacter sp.]|nr:PAS domain S-box protein [Ramlibacter sp.]